MLLNRALKALRERAKAADGPEVLLLHRLSPYDGLRHRSEPSEPPERRAATAPGPGRPDGETTSPTSPR
jgi:hypothetical protein